MRLAGWMMGHHQSNLAFSQMRTLREVVTHLRLDPWLVSRHSLPQNLAQ